MRIIIIGGSGLIGSHLFNLFKKNNKKVIATYYKKKTPKMTQYNMLKQKISEFNAFRDPGLLNLT